MLFDALQCITRWFSIIVQFIPLLQCFFLIGFFDCTLEILTVYGFWKQWHTQRIAEEYHWNYVACFRLTCIHNNGLFRRSNTSCKSLKFTLKLILEVKYLSRYTKTYDSIQIYKVLETCDHVVFPITFSSANQQYAIRIPLDDIISSIPDTLYCVKYSSQENDLKKLST